MSTAVAHVTTTAEARTQLASQVDFYAGCLSDYRASSYTDSNERDLQNLIARIAANPALLAGNLDELFNRATIALLDRDVD